MIKRKTIKIIHIGNVGLGDTVQDFKFPWDGWTYTPRETKRVLWQGRRGPLLCGDTTGNPNGEPTGRWRQIPEIQHAHLLPKARRKRVVQSFTSHSGSPLETRPGLYLDFRTVRALYYQAHVVRTQCSCEFQICGNAHWLVVALHLLKSSPCRLTPPPFPPPTRSGADEGAQQEEESTSEEGQQK